jgi:hypothetical protein
VGDLGLNVRHTRGDENVLYGYGCPVFYADENVQSPVMSDNYADGNGTFDSAGSARRRLHDQVIYYISLLVSHGYPKCLSSCLVSLYFDIVHLSIAGMVTRLG